MSSATTIKTNSLPVLTTKTASRRKPRGKSTTVSVHKPRVSGKATPIKSVRGQVSTQTRSTANKLSRSVKSQTPPSHMTRTPSRVSRSSARTLSQASSKTSLKKVSKPTTAAVKKAATQTRALRRTQKAPGKVSRTLGKIATSIKHFFSSMFNTSYKNLSVDAAHAMA